MSDEAKRRNELEKSYCSDSEVIAHLKRGHGYQVFLPSSQWVYHISGNEYFLCCENSGCCDTYFYSDDELIEYISDLNITKDDLIYPNAEVRHD